jgi:hypothetical protein
LQAFNASISRFFGCGYDRGMSPSRPPVACLTFDVDWAPEFMIDDLRELLAAYPVPVTTFCTHPSDATRRLLALPGAETAIHPNFLGGRPEAEVLAALLEHYPASRGVRNHVLYYHSRLLPLYHQRGLQYLSNDLLFLQPGIEPYYDWSGLVRLPIYWEDDVHCVYFDAQFDAGRLAMETPGLKVLNFHPVHVYLNSSDLLAYQRVKEQIRDPAAAAPLRRGGKGIRTLLIELLERAAEVPWATLSEVEEEFRRGAAYGGNYAAFLERAGGGRR